MPPGAKFPRRGDIYHLDFTPAAGTEMINRHFAIVVSPDAYNKAINRIYVAPISTTANYARDRGFHISLSSTGLRTTGVIDLTQIRAVDMKARNGQFIEKAPDVIIDEVLARIAPIFGEE